jgi:pre-mRNA-splicing factor ISY1
MARNEEKAQAMLNRWVSMKRQLGARQSEQRPSLTSSCDSISDAERWR